jgi:hypothetical protein
MDKYIISGYITVIFIIFKIIDTKFLKKHELDIKYLIRDSVLIYLSGIVANFINSTIIGNPDTKPEIAVYTGNAEF